MKNLQIHELGALFEEVQLKNVLSDSKTFPDCLPVRDLADINRDYLRLRNSRGFDLASFVKTNFSLPGAYSAGYAAGGSKKNIRRHINSLWRALTRGPDRTGEGSLLPLPHPYVVPGGRFREIYYWDSYFTMLGLRVSKRMDLVRHMTDNFAYLIRRFGYIPNGNRSYFLGRSQPPFFSLMVRLLDEESAGHTAKDGKKDALLAYLEALQKEYSFWMRGVRAANHARAAVRRVVRMPDGSVLNRYWDENPAPRPEAYREDVELCGRSRKKPEMLYRDLRAAAESGWDFSSRWFKDADSFSTIHTTEIIPVDLNCLMAHLELVLAEAYRRSGDRVKYLKLRSLAEKRKAAVLKYCWSEREKFFFDFDFIARRRTRAYTLAAAFPLFFAIASPRQAAAVRDVLCGKFLKPGGLTTTLSRSGQQWDAPNGWAPLQWIAYRGLLTYGFEKDAGRIKANWLDSNFKVYLKTGKMTEKYDVWNEPGEASGGEYPNQDGFGWTNGVFLAMTASVGGKKR